MSKSNPEIYNIYDIFEEKEEEEKKLKFGKKKSGRKSKNISEENYLSENKKMRFHSKFKKDNMRSKIITNFITFIISFLNDYGKQFINQKEDLFKKISYDLRKKVNTNYLCKLMSLSLKEFCNLKISIKHKKNERLNLNSIDLLTNYFGKDFVEMKISQFYKNFYLKENDDLKICFYQISNKTENF